MGPVGLVGRGSGWPVGLVGPWVWWACGSGGFCGVLTDKSPTLRGPTCQGVLGLVSPGLAAGLDVRLILEGGLLDVVHLVGALLHVVHLVPVRADHIPGPQTSFNLGQESCQKTKLQGR